jgi:hypothetical protein
LVLVLGVMLVAGGVSAQAAEASATPNGWKPTVIGVPEVFVATVIGVTVSLPRWRRRPFRRSA